MTHKQVAAANRRWVKNYRTDSGAWIPRLIKARDAADSCLVGIHLLNPTADELSEAFCRAQHDLFPSIIVHTRRTFGKRPK